MIRQLMLFVVLCGCVAAAAPATAEAEELTCQVRIVGLFSPNRQTVLRNAIDDIVGLKLTALDMDTARATFSFDPKILFDGYDPKHPRSDKAVQERLNGLIGQASDYTFSVGPCGDLPPDKLEKAEIRIGILDCIGCRCGVHQTVMRIEGVEQATVGQRLIVRFDPSKTSQDAIEVVLKKAEVGLPDRKEPVKEKGK